MERNERSRRAMTRAAEFFDLPADIVAGLCHLELLGDRQLFLEGHGGILSYGTEQIDVSGLCTFCRPDLFWSYRRVGGQRGAQAAMIALW